MSYKYFIKKGTVGFYFGLYPNNNNRQPIAVSNEYETFEIAEVMRNKFVYLIKNTDSPFDIRKIASRFRFVLKNNSDGISFIALRGYQTRTECKKGVERIKRNYLSELKDSSNVDNDISYSFNKLQIDENYYLVREE